MWHCAGLGEGQYNQSETAPLTLLTQSFLVSVSKEVLQPYLRFHNFHKGILSMDLTLGCLDLTWLDLTWVATWSLCDGG